MHFLISQWKKEMAAGNILSPEELCRNHPELLDDLRCQLTKLQENLDKDEAATLLPDNTTPEPTLPPECIGRYRLDKVIGKGGFGLVYLAHDEQLHRLVAIKVPHRSQKNRPEDTESYLTEARIVANLDHPHIVPVYDVGSTREYSCYIVSKFIEGHSLSQRVNKGRLSLSETTTLVAAVADALHYAHKRGLVHRDVKPGNILIDQFETPYLADFGLALKEQDFGKGGGICGTPSYMSPEQASGEGHRVDGRSDIFSLGVVFYELLAGRCPFRGEIAAILFQIVADEPKPPRQIDDTIPKELERICLKALSKRVSDRYSTAKDMADDLHNFQAQQLNATAKGSSKPVNNVSQTHLQDGDPARLCHTAHYYWNKRTEDGLRQSIVYFYKALDADPTYAKAWTGLANAYHQLAIWGHADPTSACPRAKSAALKAIELDDSIGEAHAALAVILKDYEWDFNNALISFRRAIELNPSNATTYLWYGECNACMGRHVEAIDALRHAQDLDPLSIVISATFGRHGFFFARQYENATAQMRKTVETDPAYWIAQSFLGWCYLFQGLHAEALVAFEAARKLDDNPETLACLGYFHGVCCQSNKARDCLNDLKELARLRYVPAIHFALVYTGLGDKNEAFKWLEKACDDRNQWLSEITVDPAFDSLRTDPRFINLLRRMKIDQ